MTDRNDIGSVGTTWNDLKAIWTKGHRRLPPLPARQPASRETPPGMAFRPDRSNPVAVEPTA